MVQGRVSGQGLGADVQDRGQDSDLGQGLRSGAQSRGPR